MGVMFMGVILLSREFLHYYSLPKIDLNLFSTKLIQPLPHTENNLPNIRELSDFNEIFSVDLSMNELYYALFYFKTC